MANPDISLDGDIAQLVSMDFDPEDARVALTQTGTLAAAINYLTEGNVAGLQVSPAAPLTADPRHRIDRPTDCARIFRAETYAALGGSAAACG